MKRPSRAFTAFIFIFTSLATSLASADEVPCTTSLNAPLQVTDIIKGIEVDQSRDMTKFCNHQMLERMAQANRQFRDYRKYMTTKKEDGVEIYHPDRDPLFQVAAGKLDLDNTVRLAGYSSPWDSSMVPTLLARRRLFNLAMSEGANELKAPGRVEDSLKKDCKNCPRVLAGIAPPRLKLEDLEHVALDNRASDVLTQSAMLLKVCSDISKEAAANCANAAKKNIEDMRPPGGYGVAMPQLYKEILGSGKYASGLRHFALSAVEKARSDKPITGDMFSDLKNSFLRVGESAAHADDMAWKVMALWATGGANLVPRLQSLEVAPEAGQTADALTAAALTIPFLDFKSQARGQVYSFPPNVKNGCDNGKAYHFWMSAYLARERAKESKDPKAAALAAFVAEKGYQLAGNSLGREMWRVLAYNAFNPVHNVVRMDLNFAAAGAAFGAAAGTGRTVDLDADQGYRDLLKRGPITPGQPKSAGSLQLVQQIADYARWHKIFDPDPTLFDYLKSAGF